MVLETKRLILRQWEEKDSEELYKHARDSSVGPIAGWPPHQSIDESKNIIKKVLIGDEIFSLCLKSDNKPVGSIEIKLKDKTTLTNKDNECELGFWLGSLFWGKQLMLEAINEILRHAFEDLRMSKVWCGYYDGNINSKRIQEKVGFSYKYTQIDVDVPLMNEKRVLHVTYIEKNEWDNLL